MAAAERGKSGRVMRRGIMNTNQIDYFLKAYRERSYTAAAKLVPMSAQGLTKAIHSLEGELGAPLFENDANGKIKPTPYAEEFKVFCKEFDEARSRMAAGFARLAGQAHRTIRLAAAIGSMGLLGIDLISSFKKVHPDVEVECDDLPDMRVEKTLRDGNSSLGLTVLPTSDEFETVELASCERCVWVAADDPLAAKGQVCITDLEGRNIALVGSQFKNYGLLLEALEHAGVHPADITTSSEMIWLHQFAKGPGCISFTAQSVLPLFKDDTSVVALPFTGMPYQIGISWLRTHTPDEDEQAFIKACEVRAKELQQKSDSKERIRPSAAGRATNFLRRLTGR